MILIWYSIQKGEKKGRWSKRWPEIGNTAVLWIKVSSSSWEILVSMLSQPGGLRRNCHRRELEWCADHPLLPPGRQQCKSDVSGAAWGEKSQLWRNREVLEKKSKPFPDGICFGKKKKKRQNKINRPKSRVQGIVPLERFELRTKKWEESAGRFMKLDSDIFGLVSKWDCVTLKLCIWKRRQAAQRLSLEGRCECGDGPVLVSFLFCSGGRLSLT